MDAEARLDAGTPAARERRPAVWPWLLMPLVVLLVFAALYRIHHRPGTPWAPWTHPSEANAQPVR
jgi:hypothetical protein